MWLLAEISNIFFVNFNSSSRLQFHVDLISTTYTHELGLECKFGPLNFSKLLFFFWFEAHEDDLQRSRSQVTGFLCFLFPSPYVRCRLTIFYIFLGCLSPKIKVRIFDMIVTISHLFENVIGDLSHHWHSELKVLLEVVLLKGFLAVYIGLWGDYGVYADLCWSWSLYLQKQRFCV